MKSVMKLAVAALLLSGTVALAASGGRPDATGQTACGKPGQPPCEENGEATSEQQRQVPKAGRTPANQGQKSEKVQEQTPRAGKVTDQRQQKDAPNTEKAPTGQATHNDRPAVKGKPTPTVRQGSQPVDRRGSVGQSERQPTVQEGQTPRLPQASTPAAQKDRTPFGERNPKEQSAAGQERTTGQQSQPRVTARWSRGDRLPDRYRKDQFAVRDWQRNNLPPPPRGYRWMCYERGDCFLVANSTGIIRQTYWRNERETYWQKRYARTYRYSDDLYYRECRNRPDPAGILIGGLIGGLIGNAAGDHDRAGATFLGIIIGAGLGAALTSDLDCDDRSYAYRAYYDGLNYGRPGIRHWRNPHNNHRGEFRVRSYYYDADGFRCANYSHAVYLDRTRRADGRACRQPDGAWAFVN